MDDIHPVLLFVVEREKQATEQTEKEEQKVPNTSYNTIILHDTGWGTVLQHAHFIPIVGVGKRCVY